MALFLVTPLIEGTDDIDFVQLIEANTPQQALDYFLSHNIDVVKGTEIAVTQPKVHKAVMHQCTKNVELKESIYIV